MPDTIDRLWAWIATEEDGTEGVAAFLGTDGMWMPMIAADRDRVESLRPMADVIAQATGRPLQLRRYDCRTDLETLTGEPT